MTQEGNDARKWCKAWIGKKSRKGRFSEFKVQMSYPAEDANSHRDTAGACTRAAAGAFASDPRPCRGGRTAAVDISSHGNSYTIAAFTLGTDEKGSTTITISGSGFNTMPLRNGRIVVPVLCSFTTGGEEYEWEQVQGGDGSLTFVFDTAKKPETISFYAEDKQEKKYEFKAR